MSSDRQNAYERIKEILEAYWIDEPTEEKVTVLMRFEKHNGEMQEKVIGWHNPSYQNKSEIKAVEFTNLANIKCECPWCNQDIKLF